MSVSETPAAEADPVAAGAFPVLTGAHVDVLARYGTERSLPPGGHLFRPGDTLTDFFVVLGGVVEVRDGERLLARHGRGRFIGRLELIGGETAQLTAALPDGGRVLAVPVARLRDVIASDPALSELILRALLLRRVIVTRLGAGVQVLGSRFDADTRRLLDVLARNRVPAAWIDLESDPRADGLLHQFGVSPAETPVVVTRGGDVLQNPAPRALLQALGIGSDRKSVV